MERRVGLALLIALALLGLLVSSLFGLPAAAAALRRPSVPGTLPGNAEGRVLQAAPAAIPVQGCGLWWPAIGAPDRASRAMSPPMT